MEPQPTWTTQPPASAETQEIYHAILNRSSYAVELRDRLLRDTGTRLLDWVDHFAVPDIPGLATRLIDVGFQHAPTPMAPGCYRHNGGLFPAIVLRDDNAYALSVRVESVIDAVSALKPDAPIAGRPYAAQRRALINDDGAEVWVIERNGDKRFDIVDPPAERVASILYHDEQFRLRRRAWQDPADGFMHTMQLAQAAVDDIGQALACDRFFAAERRYWQSRNAAARVQFNRQQQLGFGWGNHDHHTYRSSRTYFTQLIKIFETLGFACRERFYPGGEAGWGAQVLEHPITGIVIFADVDMTADEMRNDFSHEPFSNDATRLLGTVGLWCALHGESMLQAGMHHLEATFDFDAVRKQLSSVGIESMVPFSELPHLRQCFTVGERWPVTRQRLDPLVASGRLTKEQTDTIARDGALGSHLELLERNDGFKGFNQKGVDHIIAGTDPRKA